MSVIPPVAASIAHGNLKRKGTHEKNNIAHNESLTIEVNADEGVKKRKVEVLSTRDTFNGEKTREERDHTSSARGRTFPFIHDQYTDVRGNPVMMEVTCAKCHAWIMDYQKDGPGRLLRCYSDRIYHPSALRERRFTEKEIRSTPRLVCTECNSLLAVPIIYKRSRPKPEIRSAYKIVNSGQSPSVLMQQRKV